MSPPYLFLTMPQNKAYMFKSGMASTTNGELAEGTSKQSFHLPGYGGTIPASSRNAIAASQVMQAYFSSAGCWLLAHAMHLSCFVYAPQLFV